MIKYEYTTREVSGEREFYPNDWKDKEKEYLKEMGEAGWRLVTVLSRALGEKFLYYWERQITE